RIDDLPSSLRDELLAELAECRSTVEQAGADYERLAEDVRDVLQAVRGRLRKIQQGGKLLRSYRRSARLLR
ncbi:MAG: hypothetical protein PVJ27_05370, partial [Candidatus Brocadiaceae bacterium]